MHDHGVRVFKNVLVSDTSVHLLIHEEDDDLTQNIQT